MKISIVIPAYNEEDSINELLNILLENLGENADEIIVVDACSSDDTINIVEKWKDAHIDINLKLITLYNRAYPGRARNEGVKVASNKYIAFIDCGVFPSNDWLKNIKDVLNKVPFVDVIWANKRSKGYTSWERAFAAIVDKKQVNRHVTGSCIKKEKFYEIGGYREDLRAGEDLCYIKSILDAGLMEVFIDVDIFYTGYPQTCLSALKKWALYAEHSVYAGFYRKKSILAFTEFIALIFTLYMSWIIINNIFFTFFLLIILIFLRTILSIYLSPWSILEVDVFTSARIAICIDIGRMYGLATGLIKKNIRKLKHRRVRK